VKEHTSRNVWTKDPHGGRYRLCSGPAAKSGFDALTERADGTPLKVDLGYEKTQSGLTSNFVGNHMTQGAIDLVQADLARKDRRHEQAKLQNYMTMYHPPKRITGAVAGSASTASNEVGQGKVIGVMESDGSHGGGEGQAPVSLKDLRRAIRQQRDAKKPGDGLLYDPAVFMPQLTK